MLRRALVTMGVAVVSSLLAVPPAWAEPAEGPAVCTGDAPVAPAPGGEDGLCARPAAETDGTQGIASTTGVGTGTVVGVVMVAGGLLAAAATLVRRGPRRQAQAEDTGPEAPVPPSH